MKLFNYLLIFLLLSSSCFAQQLGGPIGGGGAGGGVTDHGLLTGLGDDDHTQYGNLSQNETVSGNWTFSDQITIGADVITSVIADYLAEINQDLGIADDVIHASLTATTYLSVSGTREWKKSALTGGGSNAADGILSTSMTDGDIIKVKTKTGTTAIIYEYVYDDDGTQDEDVPDVLRPDDLVAQGAAASYPGNLLLANYSASAIDMSTGSITLPYSTSGNLTLTIGQIGLKTDEDFVAFHGGSSGEVQDKSGFSLIHTLIVRFDPEYEYDTSTNHIIDLLELGDEAPHGFTLTEWSLEYVNGDPTNEIDLDLVCDTTPDWDPSGDATVMDVLDSTSGSSSADSGFDSSTCANTNKVYLRFGADPVDSGEIVRVKIQYFLNED